MVEVGVRELKARLSYYLQLMQAGEEIAIKLRTRIVGFLSKTRGARRGAPHPRTKRDIRKMIEQWKKEGFVISGGPYHHQPFKPVKMTPGPTTTEMIRQMRDEEWR
ncbi:MAG: hypothetical protein HYV03_01300 [Deltaproteobacteria bacterium]|nr:hypothetical protein [Deltaproteobacteria bacterium]